MAERDVNIKVKVDAGGAISLFDELGNKIKFTEDRATSAASGGFTRLQASIVSLQSAISLAQTAISAVGSTIGAVFDGLQRGSAVDDVEVGFSRLTEAAGGLGKELIGNLRTAAAGTVSDLDLMKGAITGFRANMKPDEIELVVKASRALSEEVGGDFKSTFDGLVDSLQKGNDKFLKSQGILIDNKKAYDDFAKTIGTTGDALSEQGKAAAITAASMVALQTKVASVGTITLDAGDRADIFTAKLKNVADQAWKNVAADDEINKSLDLLSQNLSSVDFTPFINGLTEILRFASLIPGALNTIGEAGARVFQFLGAAVEQPKISSFKKQLKEVEDQLKSGTAGAAEAAVAKFNKLTQAFEKQNVVVKGAVIPDLNRVGLEVQALQIKQGLLVVKTDAVTGAVGKAATGIKKSTDNLIDHSAALKKGAEAADKFKEAQEHITEVIRGMIGSSGDASFDALKNKIRDAMDPTTAGNMEAKLREIATQVYISTGNTKEFDQAVKGVEQGLKDSADSAKLLGDATKKAAEEAQAAWDNLGSSIGGAIGSAIESIGTGGDLSSVFGSLSSSIGGSIGGFLGTELSKELSKSLADSLGESLGGAVGSAIPGVGAGLGALAGDLLVKGVESLFSGKDSAGTAARKSADKFFAEAFEANRLAVIINGQLAQVKDLVFKGDSLFGGGTDFADGSFASFFDSLEPAARQAFAGVGAGFEELLGVSDDISGQIGAVLANNIGGSLNNLQLLVEASGKSFEQLREGVIETFLDGKLSALEAHSALLGIAQVAQQGIPDGIGFTIQAFENLQAAGKKGGRVSVDALKDIGFEAKELGLKDFPALIKNIEASGKFSSKEINQVFDALKASGIDTIDKLTGATAEQLIPVLANLDTVQFPFKEAVEDVNDLIKKVNELPSRIEKNLVFNVKVNTDANGEAALRAAGSTIRPGNEQGLTR